MTVQLYEPKKDVVIIHIEPSLRPQSQSLADRQRITQSKLVREIVRKRFVSYKPQERRR